MTEAELAAERARQAEDRALELAAERARQAEDRAAERAAEALAIERGAEEDLAEERRHY